MKGRSAQVWLETAARLYADLQNGKMLPDVVTDKTKPKDMLKSLHYFGGVFQMVQFRALEVYCRMYDQWHAFVSIAADQIALKQKTLKITKKIWATAVAETADIVIKHCGFDTRDMDEFSGARAFIKEYPKFMYCGELFLEKYLG